MQIRELKAVLVVLEDIDKKIHINVIDSVFDKFGDVDIIEVSANGITKIMYDRYDTKTT